MLAILFLVVGLFTSVFARSVERRAVGPTLAAPTGWKVSYDVDGKRVSNGASTDFISLFTVDQSATVVTQAHLNTCVSRCATTSSCAFVNLVKLTGSSKGNVVCMLFPHYLASTTATYTNGPQGSGGTVDYSYGVRSLCAPTNGAAPTCTPAQVSQSASATPTTTTSTSTTSTTAKTTTTTAISTTAKTTTSTTTTTKTTSTTTSSSSQSTASNSYFQTPADKSLPAAPAGATLVEWKPCKGTSLANPVMVNALAYSGSSSATTAYISQHGAGSDFDAYFTSLRNVVGDSVPLISPGFMTDNGASKYYRSGVNLAWSSTVDSWAVGEDDTTGASCSSYDQYDSMIDYLATSGRFPRLSTIFLVGHSGGGNFISRFSTINTNTPVAMKYVVANAANQAYFTSARPTLNNLCSSDGVYNYPYQWTASSNRYVSARYSSPSALFSRWAGRSVALLVGDMDTDTTGTQLCQSLRQGGPHRRDRNYAYWAYQNILAGTSANVQSYYGYGNLTAQGATTLAKTSLNHQECTVKGVGHDVDSMYQSDCGRAAIFGQSLPAGGGASYP